MYKTKTPHLISTTNLCVLKSLCVYIFQVVAFFFFWYSCVAQGCLELQVFLPLPFKCWDYKHVSSRLAWIFLFKSLSVAYVCMCVKIVYTCVNMYES